MHAPNQILSEKQIYFIKDSQAIEPQAFEAIERRLDILRNAQNNKVADAFERFLLCTPTAPGVNIFESSVPHCPGHWCIPMAASEHVVLYLHGGGFTVGSTAGYSHFATHIANLTQQRVLVLDYPLAPQFPFPKALESAVVAYQKLRELFQGQQVSLCGDSAGGGLALALLVQLLDQRSKLPSATVVFSPWIDLSLEHPRLESLQPRDRVLDLTKLKENAEKYLQGASPNNPLVSPSRADFSQSTPILIQVGSDELFVADVMDFFENSETIAPVTLEVWENKHHVFQLDVSVLAAGRMALDSAAKFIKTYVAELKPPSGIRKLEACEEDSRRPA